MPTTDPNATPATAVEGLTKRFGAVTAVDDLSFTVRPGAVTGFLGPNGAGKTTALTAIGQIVHQERIRVYEMAPRGGSLENVFFRLTEEAS
jgi:ABC-type multidrug transport system ATPase subunit